jgi:predicted enzyme related to lactoylglutathione lyase
MPNIGGFSWHELATPDYAAAFRFYQALFGWVKASGGKVLNGPMDVPGGDRIAPCLDPQGGAFAVHSRQAS